MAKHKGDPMVERRIVNWTKREEYLNINESLVALEKNKAMIRYDMNIIEFPIFSKNSRKKKNEILVYYFKNDKSSYLEVVPTPNHAIPGEFEERVFIALTKIMRNNNYGRTFITPANEIIENLSLNVNDKNQYYKKIKEAMTLLAKTGYVFKNALYSNKHKGIINDEIMTTMMNIRVITREDKESDEIEYFEDGRIKEVYQVSFSDYFYENIIRKGYLAFDSEKLLAIGNSVTRSIHTMLEKWRGYKLYLRRPAFFIARRIPLKWEKSNISKTIKTLEKACNELVELKLIESFKIIKESTWELAEFEFIFTEEHNKLKRSSFYEEKKEHNLDMQITHTEKKMAQNKLDFEANEKKLLEEQNKREQDELYNAFLELSEGDRAFVESEARDGYLIEARVKNKSDDDPLRISILKAFEKSKRVYIIDYMKNKLESEIIEEAEIEEAKIEEIEIIEQKDLTKSKPIEKKLIININKEFKSLSSFMMQILKSLRNLEIEGQEAKDILEIFPILKNYEDTLNGYDINIEFDEDTKVGTIEVNKC